MVARRGFLAGTVALGGMAAFPLRAQAPLSVVTTTAMIADAAARIGGSEVAAVPLMGPGVDPHAYRQTRSDIVAMTRADLVLAHGLFLEAQMEDFLGTLSKRVPVLAVAETLPKDVLLGHADYDNKFDPHVWMDPALWVQVIPAIEGALAQARPEAAELFAANAQVFADEVTALGGYVKQTTASVPEASRVLVTAHDAFSYFGQAFGFEVLGIQGISTESEAGLARIRELVDVLVTRQISAVFVESSVSDRATFGH